MTKNNSWAVGNFFLEKKIYPCANQCAKQAYTLDPQYVPGLMLQAQVCMLRKDWGGAGQKFDEILNIQPDNIEALRLSARVYKYVNPIVAKEALEKILSASPTISRLTRSLVTSPTRPVNIRMQLRPIRSSSTARLILQSTMCTQVRTISSRS